MIILGIDPGTATTGYGFIRETGGKLTLIDYGCIQTSSKDSASKRLGEIFDSLKELIERFKPDEAAVEELFFSSNTKTAIAVGQARGVLMLTLEKSKIMISEYTPLQVKQALVGYGRAEKKQVQIMVKNILNMDHIPTQDDAADALAIAICHAHSRKLNKFE